ncbi:MAG: anthrone oxygenase family protein [Rhizobiaceae bacterium]
MSTTLILLIQCAILAYAFVGGVFLAFSDFIMRALTRTSGHGGVEAMQMINREVFRWVFMTLFLGLAVVSLVIAAYGAIALTGPARTLIMLAGLLYLVGCFGVTVFFNVPMNNVLDGMELTDAKTSDFWFETYVPRWTFWNSIRTTACALSAASLLLGLVWMTPGQAA